MSNNLKHIFLLGLVLLSSMAVSASKRGLAWPWNGNSQDFGLFANNDNIGWIYNWESWRPDGTPGNLEYVAMQRTRDGIENLQNNMQNNGANILLGFNEPDISSQANLSPDDAVQLWQQNIQSFGGSKSLGSPAISNGPDGISWLQQFLGKCSGCKIDFVVCHWYGPDVDSFKNFIEDVHNSFPDKQIWVTEFALQGTPSQDDQSNFFDQARDYLESNDSVDRYAWFGAFRGGDGNNLINNDGSLTSLGQKYVS